MVDDDVHHLPLESGMTGLDAARAWRILECPRVSTSDQEGIVAEYSVLPEFPNTFFCLDWDCLSTWSVSSVIWTH